MVRTIITISTTDDLLSAIDQKRGDVPRSVFLTKLIAKALGVKHETEVLTAE